MINGGYLLLAANVARGLVHVANKFELSYDGTCSPKPDACTAAEATLKNLPALLSETDLSEAAYAVDACARTIDDDACILNAHGTLELDSDHVCSDSVGYSIPAAYLERGWTVLSASCTTLPNNFPECIDNAYGSVLQSGICTDQHDADVIDAMVTGSAIVIESGNPSAELVFPDCIRPDTYTFKLYVSLQFVGPPPEPESTQEPDEPGEGDSESSSGSTETNNSPSTESSKEGEPSVSTEEQENDSTKSNDSDNDSGINTSDHEMPASAASVLSLPIFMSATIAALTHLPWDLTL